MKKDVKRAFMAMGGAIGMLLNFVPISTSAKTDNATTVGLYDVIAGALSVSDFYEELDRNTVPEIIGYTVYGLKW